jgi:murein DD-endopeptidase MepM/ murein hydrolase activator NlpD
MKHVARAGWVSWVVVIAAAALAADSTAGLEVSVRAREIAPGEPLRVVVRSAVPLASLEGRFLEQQVYMVRESGTDDGEVWSGWTMVALDQQAVAAAIDLEGTRADGTAVIGTHAVSIRHKEFPEERLTVSSKYVEPPAEVQERLASERAKVAEVYRERRDLIPAGESFVRPVPGEPTSTFGTRRLFNEKPRSPHPGLDLRAATGTPVKAAGAGVVGIAQDLYYSGGTVIIDHGGGLFTIYAHLSEIGVDVGDEIAAGAPIGESGATGRVTGPHLHWGAKIGNRPFDPTALLDPVLFFEE